MSKQTNFDLAADKDESKPYPYPPSLLDRFMEWVGRLPGRSWMFYFGFGLVLAFVLTVVQWHDGSYPAGTFNAFHIWFAFQTSYFLTLMRFLDGTAKAALMKFRPALNVSEAEYSELNYRLTTAPARPTLLASLAGVTLAVLLLPTTRDMLLILNYSFLPIGFVITYGLFFLFMGVAGAFVYHTLQQLRLVSHIYATQALVNLYDLTPLYAFSGLTSRTAVGLIIFNFLWFSTAPYLLSHPVGIGFGIFYTVVAAITFVWPLLGIHRRLVEEKQRLIRENSQYLAATSAELHNRVNIGDLHSMDELHHTMSSLEIERSSLSQIPTWPWEPETLRTLITALLLPIMVFFLQFILQRVFDQ